MCSSAQNPSCADGYQTGQMQYVDCSTQSQQQFGQFPQQQGQFGIPGQQPGLQQPGGQFPGQQFGGQYGGNMDRCTKTTLVGSPGINGQRK